MLWLSCDTSVIASFSLFDTNNNGVNESKIFHEALRNNGAHANVENNNDASVAPRNTVSLEHTKKHACESCEDAQDHAWRANRKEGQPIDLKIAFELRPNTSPDDDSTQSTMEALAED